ncbi:MAG: hypothetical protein AB7U61_04580 [Methylocystis sp.]
MTIITKAGLAAELGITRGRVTQYANQGMPIRSDGKLDREKALEWIRRNVDATTSSKGLFAAAKTQKRSDDDDDNPVTLAVNIALGLLFAHIPAIAVAAAKEAGVPDEQAERIRALAHKKAIEAGETVMTKFLGQEPRGEWLSLEDCRKIGG